MKKNLPFQLQFVNQLKQVVPNSVVLADELADLLEVSTDSAYRRLRCETAISIDEVILICNKFGVSLSSITTENSSTVAFHYNLISSNKNGLYTYLNNILHDLEQLSKFDNNQIVFAAEDIPLFHYFAYPELTALKLFYWNKSILNNPELEGKKYDTSLINEEFKTITRKILEVYCQIPSKEIWTLDTINSVVKQIEFYWDSGLFTKQEDAILVCNQLSQMLESIQLSAEEGFKFHNRDNRPKSGEPNYDLYLCDVMIGTNCILSKHDDVAETFLSYHTFNSMATNDSRFCYETEVWLNNLIKKSTLVSCVAEKQRYQFFKKNQEKIITLIKKIENE
ncbi:MAG: hypothetical protein V4667_06295 [Bacteroidota bacterium]